LVRPLGMTFPGATATISTVPTHAQTIPIAKAAAIVALTARPTGLGGVSTISSAAGRKAISSLLLAGGVLAGNGTTLLADFMQPRLKPE